jgi:crotonobetainyl-CoA:carnitine CoA-transferase CaiB-like acyl-CoA transferase
VKLGDVANAAAQDFGRPLDGVRVLAMEQLQAMPVCTLLLSRLGAEVVKLESPGTGENARQSMPQITDRAGHKVGATYLRYGLGKKSITVDIRSDKGRQLVEKLAPHFDVVCENLGPGRAAKFGVGYEQLSKIAPKLIYLSISGFGERTQSPYAKWPAFAGVAEAMSGVYEYARRPHQPPVINPVGGVGDTASGLMGIIGILAALRHRDRIGRGQHIDISMADTMLLMCDHVTNYWSLGHSRQPDEPFRLPLLASGFRAKDGWFMVQAVRRHQFERIANLVGHPEWLQDKRFDTQFGWTDHLEEVLRPGIEAWARNLTKFEASRIMAEAGIAAAPCSTAEDVAHDPHVKLRNMLVEVPRPDGVAQPVLVPGNPVKMSCVTEGPETIWPVLGEHNDEVLGGLLGLGAAELAALKAEKVI